MIPEIDAALFETEVIQSDRAVLVDFFTPLCSPCRAMLPIVSEVAEERTATLKAVKIDAAKHPELAARYRVNGVPNFLLFRRGEVIAQRRGSTPKRELIAWLDGAIV